MSSRKYNRTYHFPFSPGASSDDKIASSFEKLIGVPIVISEKLDGGNASLEYDGVFARSHASTPTHPSFDHLKALHATVKHKIPKDYQLFGENVCAVHSCVYDQLPGYFLLFNVRHQETWLSWEEVEMWAEEIGVPTVPVLFSGSCSSEKELQDLVEDLMKQPSKCGGDREGVVARIARQFSDMEFANHCIKSVRAGHITSDEHWSHKTMVKNKLAGP